MHKLTQLVGSICHMLLSANDSYTRCDDCRTWHQTILLDCQLKMTSAATATNN